MTYTSYEIRIEVGGEFDQAFRGFCKRQPVAGGRLFGQLRQFARSPKSCGERIWKTPNKSYWVVPPSYELDSEAAAGILVEIDGSLVRPILFLPPTRERNWDEYLAWIKQRHES